MKKRFDNIDLLKSIAILMVIILHSGMLNTNFIENSTFGNYLQYVFRLIMEGVPIFILVNGYLLINKSFNLKKHTKKVLKILILLVLWSFIYTILFHFINNEKLSFNIVFRCMFSVSEVVKYTGTLWFLQSLISLYLIFPALKVLHDNNKTIYNYLFIIVALFTFGTNTLSLLYDLTKIEKILIINKYISHFNCFDTELFIFYFMLGGYLFELCDKISFNKKKKIIIIVIGILSYVISASYGIYVSQKYDILYNDRFNSSAIFLVPTIISLFVITTSYKDKNRLYNKIIEGISKNTMGMYLIHPICIKILYNVMMVSNNVCFMSRMFNMIIIFWSSYFISILLNRIPCLKNIIKI